MHVPVHIVEYLIDGGHQAVLVGMWTSIGPSLDHAPEKIIHWIEVRGARRPQILGDKVKTVGLQEVHGDIRHMAGCRVLLPHPGPFSSHILDPGQQHILHNLHIDLRVDPETRFKHVRRHNITITPNTMTVAGNFVFMTFFTWLVQEAIHLLFCLLTFWSWQKFFSSEKNQSMPGSLGCFSLLSSFTDLNSLVSMDLCVKIWPTCIL